MFYSSYMPGDSYYPVPSLTVASFLHKTAGVAGLEPATKRLTVFCANLLRYTPVFNRYYNSTVNRTN